MELADCYDALGLMNEKVRIWSKLLKAYAYDVYATDRIQWHCRDHEGEKEIFDMLHKLVLAFPDNRAYQGLLGMCYAQYGKKDLAKRYLDKYRALNSAGDNTETRDNYLKLAALLNQRGIKGVFVEYPARSAVPLKRIYDSIDDNKNFVVVDNEALFKDALDPSRYHEYFTDRSLENIGHCTPKGNRMLAEHIAESILGMEN